MESWARQAGREAEVNIDRKTLGVLVAVAAGACLPFLLSRHWVNVLDFAAIYTIAGLGVGLLLGQTGIVNLGQAVFYGIGAYSSAYFSVELGYPTPVGIAVGAGLSMATAWVVGWPVLRLTGFFLALATMALAMIATVLFLECDWITGGTLGIGGIPKLVIFGFPLDTPSSFYYFVWPLAGLCLWLAHNLGNGRVGLAMRAMRDAPEAAMVLAVDMHALRTKIFVLSALFGSLGGSVFAHYAAFVSVESFTIERSITFLLIAVLGGTASVWGTVIGALFITIVPEVLSRLGDIHQVVFGLALVLVVTLMPEGLFGLVQRAHGFLRSLFSSSATAKMRSV
jgi:branched-chain amino acid transport system permease protein